MPIVVGVKLSLSFSMMGRTPLTSMTFLHAILSRGWPALRSTGAGFWAVVHHGSGQTLSNDRNRSIMRIESYTARMFGWKDILDFIAITIYQTS